MIVLDESIPRNQVERLLKKRIRVRKIDIDLNGEGLSDEDVIPRLLKLRRPTFFTLDVDYFKAGLCHKRYCLIWLDVHRDRTAEYCLRLLKHSEFDTKAKRLGCVIRAAPSGVYYWRVKGHQQEFLPWDD